MLGKMYELAEKKKMLHFFSLKSVKNLSELLRVMKE